MPRVAATAPFFDFFPELKAELAARYPGTRFRNTRHRFSEDELIDFHDFLSDDRRLFDALATL